MKLKKEENFEITTDTLDKKKS